MKKKWKIALAVAVVLIAAVAVSAGIKYNQRGIVTVQTGKVARQDLAVSRYRFWRNQAPQLHQLRREHDGPGANHADPRCGRRSSEERRRSSHVWSPFRPRRKWPRSEPPSDRPRPNRAPAKRSLRAADQAIITAEASLERAKADLDRARIDFSVRKSFGMKSL